MYMDNHLKTLILETVNNYYTSEQDFYKKRFINFNQVNWSKFKNNAIKLQELKADRVQCMLDDLFTSYEQYLIAITQQNFYFAKCENFTDFYTQVKLNEIKHWFETQSSKIILKSKKLYDITGKLTRTYFTLSIVGTHKAINLIPTHTIHMTAVDDKRRLNWIENNLEYMK